MPNLANTLKEISLQEIYSLIYRVYQDEADRQNCLNNDKKQALLAKSKLTPLDEADKQRLEQTNEMPSVSADILLQKLANTLCIMHNTTGTPNEIAKSLFLLENRVQRAGAGSDTSYQVTTFINAAMNASAILDVHRSQKSFGDTSEIDAFALANHIKIEAQQNLICNQFDSFDQIQGSNLDLSLADQKWLKTRNNSWDLFEELENKYTAVLNYPGLHEPSNPENAVESTPGAYCTDSTLFDDVFSSELMPNPASVKNYQKVSMNQHISHSSYDSPTFFRLKNAIEELIKLTPNPCYNALAIPLSQEEQTTLIRALYTKTQELTKFITPETQSYIRGIQEILIHETIKIHLIAYKTYLEKTYGIASLQNSHPQKKYEAISRMLELLHEIKFVPGRLKQISHLLENKSSTLRSFQPRNDPGISLLQWLKAVGHTFKNFLKT